MVDLPATQRLVFRAWREDDLPLALALWGDPRVTKLIDARGALSREQVAERLHAEIAMAAEHGVQYWPVFLRDDETHIGCCGLRPYKPAESVYELGVHIRADYWGQGYASEAALAAMAYAFVELVASALFAGHNPSNTVSERLVSKLGFRYTHDETYAPTGLDHPSYLLTAAEYQRRYGRDF